jgi:hypothetical protein
MEEREREIEQVEYEDDKTRQPTSRDIRKDRDVRYLRMSYVTTLRTPGMEIAQCTQIKITEDMQGQATESDYHMVQGKSVGNEKQRAATTVSGRRSATPVAAATLNSWSSRLDTHT